jgi:hypothetical protein
MLVQEWHDLIVKGARADSDHEAYRLLADAVVKTLGQVDDPDDWDDDAAEVDVLIRFVEWLPDMIRHADAGLLRRKSLTYGGTTMLLLQALADEIDSFSRSLAGQWIRKTDGAPVPWPVVKE